EGGAGGVGVAGLPARRDHGVKERAHAVGVGVGIGAGDPEGLRAGVGGSAHGARRFLFLAGAHALDAERGVLRTAIAFFLDLQLLPPQVAEQRVALHDAVVAEALRKGELAAVAELPDERLHAPLGVAGRLLGAAAEEDVVLDLEAPDLLFQDVQFFVNGHAAAPDGGGSAAAARRSGIYHTAAGHSWALVRILVRKQSPARSAALAEVGAGTSDRAGASGPRQRPL